MMKCTKAERCVILDRSEWLILSNVFSIIFLRFAKFTASITIGSALNKQSGKLTVKIFQSSRTLQYSYLLDILILFDERNLNNINPFHPKPKYRLRYYYQSHELIATFQELLNQERRIGCTNKCKSRSTNDNVETTNTETINITTLATYNPALTSPGKILLCNCHLIISSLRKPCQQPQTVQQNDTRGNLIFHIFPLSTSHSGFSCMTQVLSSHVSYLI